MPTQYGLWKLLSEAWPADSNMTTAMTAVGVGKSSTYCESVAQARFNKRLSLWKSNCKATRLDNASTDDTAEIAQPQWFDFILRWRRHCRHQGSSS